MRSIYPDFSHIYRVWKKMPVFIQNGEIAIQNTRQQGHGDTPSPAAAQQLQRASIAAKQEARWWRTDLIAMIPSASKPTEQTKAASQKGEVTRQWWVGMETLMMTPILIQHNSAKFSIIQNWDCVESYQVFYRCWKMLKIVDRCWKMLKGGNLHWIWYVKLKSSLNLIREVKWSSSKSPTS